MPRNDNYDYVFYPPECIRHGFHPMDIMAMHAEYDPEGYYPEETVAKMIEAEMVWKARMKWREARFSHLRDWIMSKSTRKLQSRYVRGSLKYVR